MARVRSGQARPGPWFLTGVLVEVSGIKGDFACTLTRHFPSVLVVLWSQSRLMLEGRARTLSGPSPDPSPARTPAPSARCDRDPAPTAGIDRLQLAEDNAGPRPRCGGRTVGVIAMRRLGVIVVLGTLLGMFGGVLTASPALASASGKPTRVPLPGAETFDLPAGLACSFEVAAQPVINKEFTKTFPPEPNGDVVVLINGRLVEQLTKVSTGRSITVNISGPATEVLHSDGSVTLTARGSSFLILFPTDITPGPAFLINTGRYVATFNAAGQETLISQSGTQFDVCAAL